MILLSLVSIFKFLEKGYHTSPARRMLHHVYPAAIPRLLLSEMHRVQTSVYLLCNQVLNLGPIRLSYPVAGFDGLMGSGSGRNACSSVVVCRGRWQCSCLRSRFWRMRFCVTPLKRWGSQALSLNFHGIQGRRSTILRRQVCAMSGSLVHQ